MKRWDVSKAVEKGKGGMWKVDKEWGMGTGRHGGNDAVRPCWARVDLGRQRESADYRPKGWEKRMWLCENKGLFSVFYGQETRTLMEAVRAERYKMVVLDWRRLSRPAPRRPGDTGHTPQSRKS